MVCVEFTCQSVCVVWLYHGCRWPGWAGREDEAHEPGFGASTHFRRYRMRTRTQNPVLCQIVHLPNTSNYLTKVFHLNIPMSGIDIKIKISSARYKRLVTPRLVRRQNEPWFDYINSLCYWWCLMWSFSTPSWYHCHDLCTSSSRQLAL